MDIVIRTFRRKDRIPVLDIFNRFVRESFAAYPEEAVEPDFFDHLLDSVVVLRILEVEGTVTGFGFIRPFMPLSNFVSTGVLTYFILPEFTRKGLGTKLLDALIDAGCREGITNYLANISSRNEQSLAFHRKHGFREVGCFTDVGVKFGESFDIVWMQKQFEGK